MSLEIIFDQRFDAPTPECIDISSDVPLSDIKATSSEIILPKVPRSDVLPTDTKKNPSSPKLNEQEKASLADVSKTLDKVTDHVVKLEPVSPVAPPRRIPLSRKRPLSLRGLHTEGVWAWRAYEDSKRLAKEEIELAKRQRMSESS